MTAVIPAPWPEEVDVQIQGFLQNGKTIAFPTETFYGLGGNALSEHLVERIFQIKKRARHKALLLLIEPAWLPQLSVAPTFKVEKLIERFWPGPLTLIVPAHKKLPQFLLAPAHTIAVRHSSAWIVQKLIALGQCPLIGTSANVSDTPENSQAAGVLSQLEGQLDLLIDGGATVGGAPSTLVDTTTSPFKIIRQGAVSQEDLHPYL